jgi:putative endopeptidase
MSKFIYFIPLLSSIALAQPSTEQFNQDWLDTNISPQSNFYLFANGGWIKSNPIPKSEAEWSVFNVLQKKVDTQLKLMLLNLPKHPSIYNKKINQELYLYFKSGLDNKTIEQAGIEPIKPLIHEIKTIHDLESMIAILTRLHQIDIPVFFSFDNFNDLHRKDLIIGNLSQSALILPDRNYYLKTDSKTKKIQTAYQVFIESIFQNLGYSKTKAHLAYQDVWAIEHQLASISNDREYFRSPKNIDHVENLININKKYPNILISQYLSSIGMNHINELNIANPNFFDQLNHYIPTLKYRAIQHYFIASLFSDIASKLNSNYAGLYCEFAKSIRGFHDCPPTWQQIINSENYYLGYALGDLYVASYEKKGTTQYIQTMLQDIRRSLKQKLTQNSWLSPQTKQEAQTKLAKMSARIGYPEPLDYSNLHINSKIYINNVLEARRFEVSRQWKKIGTKANPNEWEMPPQSINAYYNASQNQINIPLGILQAPFFSINAPGAANYGGIGVVIGHEIFHGFDDEGSQFNADGIYKTWWTQSEWQYFQKQVNCIIQQYSAYQIPQTNLFVQGKLVSGEAIADLGGISLALDAYEHSNYKNIDKTIDNYTPIQQFFIRFSQIWASHIKKEEAYRKGLIDSHPPKEFRVNGTLKNVPEFYSAFNIKAPKDRCYLF